MAKVRNERLREELKKTVSAIIFDMKDPRIPAVTSITEMEITPDLKYAKAHVSVYDADENAAKTAVDALNHAAGFIGHEVGSRMTIRRTTPVCHFPQRDLAGSSAWAIALLLSPFLCRSHISLSVGISSGFSITRCSSFGSSMYP